jgi:hypothetical protein
LVARIHQLFGRAHRPVRLPDGEKLIAALLA